MSSTELLSSQETQIYPLFDDYSMEYRKSIVDICDTWDSYTREDIFLQSKYLLTLEKFPPKGMDFRYVCLMKGGKAIGVFYYQLIKLNLSDSLQYTDQVMGFFEKIAARIKSAVASLFETHMLISGNTLITGDYGYHIKGDYNTDQTFKFIDQILVVLKKNLLTEGIKVGVELKKDYPLDQLSALKEEGGFSKFKVQPNMKMILKPEWKNFEDYLAAMKSKYRIRAKRAFKKAKNLRREVLDLDRLQELKTVMYQQYLETVEGAGFNLFLLREDYFLELKRNFEDQFEVVGYFDPEDELVGYYTYFNNYNVLEAHFLGYRHIKNERYQSYLNFLFDMVRVGIDHKMEGLHLSRTAMEIKSSVGATGEDLAVFLRHGNYWVNKYLSVGLDYFVPDDKWKPRTPFKNS